eukprot:6939914-Lingulodinium_polyedra.AAC.1
MRHATRTTNCRSVVSQLEQSALAARRQGERPPVGERRARPAHPEQPPVLLVGARPVDPPVVGGARSLHELLVPASLGIRGVGLGPNA